MGGFADVMFRGLTLICASLVLGGVAWLGLVLRIEPGMKPDASARRALRVVAIAAALGGIAQAVAVVIAVGTLLASDAGLAVSRLFGTTYARVALARIAFAAITCALAARLAIRPVGRAPWTALLLASVAFVGTSSLLSHAVARLEHRGLLLSLDAAHQLAAAVWVGGLGHLTFHAARGTPGDGPPVATVVQRFSTLALGAMTALVIAGSSLAVVYLGDPRALVGTAYGVMILTKILVLAGALGFAVANVRMVRSASATPGIRLFRFVEVEWGLGLTLLFAAASLTSLPPAADVGDARAAVSEVVARLSPVMPRLTSPPIDELVRSADPLMAATGGRMPIERAWSEYNHHWAGLFVVLLGVGAALERLGVRAATHWPLGFFGLAAFLFVRNDPRAWPLGPAGFWESFTLPDVLQHRGFVVLVIAFGIF